MGIAEKTSVIRRIGSGLTLLGISLNMAKAQEEVFNYLLGETSSENAFYAGELEVERDFIVGLNFISSFTLNSPGQVTADRLNVGHNVGGTLTQTGGSISTVYQNIGLLLGGYYDQQGGTNHVTNTLYMGSYNDANGRYDLKAGSLTVDNQLIVGNGGGGDFQHTGGTATVLDLVLGYFSEASGAYSISGFANLNVTDDLIVGRGKYGSFSQTASSTVAVADDLTIAWNESSSEVPSRYAIDSGTLTVGDILRVGYEGAGEFDMSDSAVVTVSSAVHLGEGDTDQAKGTFKISGGTFTTRDNFLVGMEGTGHVVQTGGNLRVDRWLDIGAEELPADEPFNLNLFELKGGSLSVGEDITVGEDTAGTFIQTGGSITVEDEFIVAGGGLGSYQISNGTLAVTDDLVVGDGGPGSVTQTGGTITVTDDLYVAEASSGEYDISGGSLTVDSVYVRPQVEDSTDNSGAVTISGGTFTTNGSFNLGYGSMVEDPGAFFEGAKMEITGGTLSVAHTLRVGSGTKASVLQQQGDVITTDLNLGERVVDNDISEGSYVMRLGTLSVDGEMNIGVDGRGTFLQELPPVEDWPSSIDEETGDIVFDTTLEVEVGGDLDLGEDNGSVGTYTLNNGTLEVEGDIWAGYEGAATMVFSEGTETTVGVDVNLGYESLSEATFSVTGGTLNIGHDLLIGRKGEVEFTQSGGEITVAGTTTVGELTESVASYEITAGSLTTKDMVNGGTVNVENSGVVTATDSFTNEEDTELVVDGILNTELFTNEAGAVVKGTGIIDADHVINRGTLAAGNSPGELTIMGDLTMEATSQMIIEISGASAGTQYDVINVTGSLIFGGELVFAFMDGFSPDFEHEFDFISANSLGGNFDAVSFSGVPGIENYNLVYSDTGVMLGDLVVSAVPEPAVAATLVSVLSLMVACGRRLRIRHARTAVPD